MNADAFQPLVVAYRNGAPVRLDQVATVIDSVEDNTNASWLYTKAGASARSTCRCMRQPGSNTIEVTDAIRALLPTFERAAAAVGPPDGPRRPLEEHPRGLQRHPVDDARSRSCWSSA